MTLQVDLPAEMNVQLSVNLSLRSTERETIDSFIRDDVTNQRLTYSQRYATLRANDWENIGTLTHLRLPQGSHILSYRVSGDFSDLTADYGKMVLIGAEIPAASPSALAGPGARRSGPPGSVSVNGRSFPQPAAGNPRPVPPNNLGDRNLGEEDSGEANSDEENSGAANELKESGIEINITINR